MALKYFFEWRDVNNVLMRCEIASSSYVGTSIEIEGYCVLDYAEVDDHLEPFRSVGLQMIVKATTARDFKDLYSDEERIWRCTFERNSTLLFDGWLSPENIYQDFVNDKWDLTLEAVSALGYLENLRYEDPTTGYPYLNQMQTPIEIIANCMKRAGIELDIYVSMNVEYDGLSGKIETNAKLKVDRYYKEDKTSRMDCKEVVESILRAFGCTMVHHLGRYYIYDPDELAQPSGQITWEHYDSDGVSQGGVSWNEDETIGSAIDDAALRHCNENQAIYMRPSLAASRVKYDYGFDDSIFTNPDLIWDSGGSATIDGWTELVGADVIADKFKEGSYHDIQLVSDGSPSDILESDNIPVTQDDALTFDISLEFGQFIQKQSVVIELDDSGGPNVYTLNADGAWNLSGSDVIDLNPELTNEILKENNYKIAASPVPVDGDIKVTFKNPLEWIATTDKAVLTTFKVYPTKNTNPEGETHTVFRNSTNKSTKVDDVIEVFNGDNDTNIYYGTIYEDDEDTKTADWNRIGVTETKPLLRLLAEKRIRMYQSPGQYFSGDVKGYFDYIKRFSIDDVDGTFLLTRFRYDSKRDEVSAVFREIFTSDVATQDYEFELDYGNTVKPTVKG